jgi:hypothetical protein
MTAIDLTGSWVGHYEQSGGRHGISMHVVQRGQSFVGRMRDVDTLLASRGIVHARAADDATAKPIVVGEAEVLSSLPEHSVVEGEVDGRVVTFVKRYQGKTSTSVQLVDKPSIAFESPGYDVHYLGTLAPDGGELAGHWTIDSQQGGPPQRDRFVLRRIAR